MKRNEEQADKGIMDRLDLLRHAPERDPRAASAGRANFLSQVEGLGAPLSARTEHRPARPTRVFPFAFPLRRASPALKALVAVLLVLVIVFGGTASTVYAAQNSLPGEALYPLKTLSEDTLLSLTPSSPERLNLTLDFSDRRLVEITSLQSAGRPIPQKVVDRFQGELDQALALAAGMTDPALAQSLDKVSQRTQRQLRTMTLLVNDNPGAPFLADLYARLQEQADVSAQGKADPQGFRLKVNQLFQGKNEKPGNGLNGPPGLENTPVPHGNGNGSGGNSPEGTPGQGQNGKGNNKPTKTPGDHGHGPGSPDTTHEPGGSSGH